MEIKNPKGYGSASSCACWIEFIKASESKLKLQVRGLIQDSYKIQMSAGLQKQLKNMFNCLRTNNDKNSPVQRSSLITLFQYHNMDTQMPEYYRYLYRSLQKLPDENVKEDDFLKIVMNPDIDLSLGTKDQLADAFSILDIDKQGSIDMNKFMKMYEDSENFQLLSPAQKKDIMDEIKQAFFSVSEDKKITPMDFYQIVKFRNW